MTAIFPGSFDPPTLGHVDVIRRAACIFDRLVVAVMVNSAKTGLFGMEERCEMLRECCADIPNVEVIFSDRLTIDLARDYAPSVIVKGLRTASDYDYEAMIASANMEAGGLDTVFIMSQPEHSRITSTVVREFAAHGGNVEKWAPEPVVRRVRERFQNR